MFSKRVGCLVRGLPEKSTAQTPRLCSPFKMDSVSMVMAFQM